MECTRPDISERLTMALFPEDFPEEQQKIQEHVHECSSCRKELEMLQSLREAIREHRTELVDSVSECPSAAEIVEFCIDEHADPSVMRHMDQCCECKEEVELIRELHSEGTGGVRVSAPTAEEKLIVRNAVLREYGEVAPKTGFSVSTWFSSLLSMLHVPSMALGAVAAALLVAVLVPWTSKEAPSRLVLSDARWESPFPESMTKGGEVFTHAKKVALIILMQEGAGLASKEVAQLYEKVNLAKDLGEHYELISPGDVKKALDGLSQEPLDVSDAARMVMDKTDADYVLVFRVGGSGSRLNLAGSLFERPGKNLLGSASWDGIPKDWLSDKIARMGSKLLNVAER